MRRKTVMSSIRPTVRHSCLGTTRKASILPTVRHSYPWTTGKALIFFLNQTAPKPRSLSKFESSAQIPISIASFLGQMSDRVTDQIGTTVRRLSQTLNRKVSGILVLLFNHKHSGSFGALAGFAIAVIFTWRFMKSAPGRPRGNRPKRGGDEGNGVGLSSQDCSLESNLKDLDVVESSIELNLRQIVRRKLHGGRKMTCQLLGVILEERSPEELQKQATVRPSVLEVLLEISKTCDIYLMERVLDDESEERVLSALDGAGLFATGALTKDRVLFCSTDMGRSSFVRQLEPDWHIDSNLEIVSQLARFIRHQLHISELELGQIASNVFTSRSLEQYFGSL